MRPTSSSPARPSLARLVPELPHLAVLRTLSKAHGLAGARCGALIADPEIVALLRKIIPPYAIPQLTLEAVLDRLTPAARAESRARLEVLLAERERLLRALPRLAGITQSLAERRQLPARGIRRCRQRPWRAPARRASWCATRAATRARARAAHHGRHA